MNKPSNIFEGVYFIFEFNFFQSRLKTLLSIKFEGNRGQQIKNHKIKQIFDDYDLVFFDFESK